MCDSSSDHTPTCHALQLHDNRVWLLSLPPYGWHAFAAPWCNRGCRVRWGWWCVRAEGGGGGGGEGRGEGGGGEGVDGATRTILPGEKKGRGERECHGCASLLFKAQGGILSLLQCYAANFCHIDESTVLLGCMPIIVWLFATLAQVPSIIHFLDSIPKNAMGKVRLEQTNCIHDTHSDDRAHEHSKHISTCDDTIPYYLWWGGGIALLFIFISLSLFPFILTYWSQ